VELFINYDCDFEAIDLFRLLVDAFSKIAKVKAKIYIYRSYAVLYLLSCYLTVSELIAIPSCGIRTRDFLSKVVPREAWSSCRPPNEIRRRWRCG